MTKKFPALFLASLAALTLASCQNQHTHAYDLETPTWEWSQFTSASVSFTCKDCDESAEGHVYTVEAAITLKESVAATCETAGHKTYLATATYEGKTFTDTKTQPIPASGHSEDSSAWNYDGNKHWHPCLYCGDSYHYQEAEHTMTDWSETLAPTYHQVGSKERHCTVCAYTETEEVAKLRYSYEQVKAFAEEFSGFESGSAYLGRALDALLDGVENMDETDKAAHVQEVSQWQEAATKEKAAYDKFYSIIVDTEGMDTYEKTKTSVVTNATYGNVLKVNADETLVAGECWSYGPDRKASLLQEGISAVRFAIYAPQPMNVSFINGACDTWYDAASGSVVKAKAETTINKGEWKEFTIPTSAINAMDTFLVSLYLSPSPFIGYGIPTSSEQETYGSAYISEIIGVKDAYYEGSAIELDERIASFEGKTLTMWNGAEIAKIRSDYEALPAAAKGMVKNLEALSNLESAYNEKWVCYNYSWGKGKVNNSTTFTSSMGTDETYGVYTQFDNASDGWIVHFTPNGSAAITKDVQMAVYNPFDRDVVGYLIDNGWDNCVTGFAVHPGWNVIELPAASFLKGSVDGISVGFDGVREGSGFKYSAIYSEK